MGDMTTSGNERRILQLERKVWHLGAIADQGERRLTGFEQQLWQRYGQFAASGTPPPSTDTWTITLTGCNSTLVPGQAFDVVDSATLAIVYSGTLDGSAQATITLAQYPSGYWVSAGLSGSKQRFDPNQNSITLLLGGGSVSGTLDVNSGYHALPTGAWPISDTLSAYDGNLLVTETLAYSFTNTWVDTGYTTLSYGGYGACPSSLVDIIYSMDFGTLYLDVSYSATAPGCPTNAGLGSGISRADITVIDGLTPIITAIPRASQKIWAGATSALTITEL